MTVEAKRQMARGLHYQLSWVWARDIGDQGPENAFDRVRERGVVNDIPSHRITGNFIYEMPFGRGKRFGGGAGRLGTLLIGGWEISGIYSVYSGVSDTLVDGPRSDRYALQRYPHTGTGVAAAERAAGSQSPQGPTLPEPLVRLGGAHRLDARILRNRRERYHQRSRLARVECRFL
jgi:hypothetical protein